MRYFSCVAQALLILVVIMASATAWAQSDADEPLLLEEMVVVGRQDSYLPETVSSATKTDANPFDVPLSVTTINEVLLKDLRAETLLDAYGYATGISVSGLNAQSFTLRGLPANLQSVQVNGLPGLAACRT